uniref:Ig-like domain-containing protein n=1 Tax=Neogobius melanostomus TaxID=47308 RepID=A0A8C6UIN2_9GOBI
SSFRPAVGGDFTESTKNEVLELLQPPPVVVDRGQNVTLRCSYKVSSSGPLSSCWSKGELPYSGMCGAKTLISSDGHRVTERVSERYLLLGRLDQGDVSLTILNVSDAGTYGCRVDKPGWNNDQKHHIKLEKCSPLTSSEGTKGEIGFFLYKCEQLAIRDFTVQCLFVSSIH